MENKRSKGVTMFAWSVIILNILTLLFLKPWATYATFLTKNALIMILAYSILYAIASFFAGVNTLRLKERARKLLIALTFLGILDMALFVPINHMMIEKTMTIMKTDTGITDLIGRKYDKLTSEGKLKMAGAKDEFISSFFNTVAAMAKIINNISVVLFALYGIGMIWLFTRPSVKTQFKT